MCYSHCAELNGDRRLSSGQRLLILDRNLTCTKKQVPLGAHLPAYHKLDCPTGLFVRGQYECGALQVPLDWHDHDSGSTTLNVFRRPAQNASESTRRGTIFVHTGMNPDYVLINQPDLWNLAGLSYLGVDMPDLAVWSFATQLWANESLQYILGDEYDLVYWTPRDRNLTGLWGFFPCHY